jgi:hypothetical protein
MSAVADRRYGLAAERRTATLLQLLSSCIVACFAVQTLATAGQERVMING